MKNTLETAIRVSELEEQRDALKTKINTAEDAEAPDQTEIDRLGGELRASEGDLKTARTEYRAALEADVETGAPVVDDAEYRERIELRAKATIGAFLMARMQGRMVSGAEAEYAAACGVHDGIPIDIFEKDRPAPVVEHRADGATVSPATGTGATLAPDSAVRILEKHRADARDRHADRRERRLFRGDDLHSVIGRGERKGVAQESTAAVLTATDGNPAANHGTAHAER